MNLCDSCTRKSTCGMYEIMGVSAACTNYENATKVLSDIVSGGRTTGLKFVEGGWYQQRNKKRTYQIEPVKGYDPFVWKCGEHTWCADGKFRGTGMESDMDLVHRVMPPTDYVGVTKWLWEADVYDGDRFITRLRTINRTESIPQREENSLRNWSRVEGSEVEE